MYLGSRVEYPTQKAIQSAIHNIHQSKTASASGHGTETSAHYWAAFRTCRAGSILDTYNARSSPAWIICLQMPPFVPIFILTPSSPQYPSPRVACIPRAHITLHPQRFSRFRQHPTHRNIRIIDHLQKELYIVIRYAQHIAQP